MHSGTDSGSSAASAAAGRLYDPHEGAGQQELSNSVYVTQPCKKILWPSTAASAAGAAGGRRPIQGAAKRREGLDFAGRRQVPAVRSIGTWIVGVKGPGAARADSGRLHRRRLDADREMAAPPEKPLRFSGRRAGGRGPCPRACRRLESGRQPVSVAVWAKPVRPLLKDPKVVPSPANRRSRYWALTEIAFRRHSRAHLRGLRPWRHLPGCRIMRHGDLNGWRRWPVFGDDRAGMQSCDIRATI